MDDGCRSICARGRCSSGVLRCREREVRNTYNRNGIDVILDYFEDTYIGIQRRGRPRDVPMFPIRIWNMYDKTQDDLPRTNNHIEDWHKGFSGNCDGTHSTVWKLIRAFQRAEVAARTDLHQVLGGHPVVPKKKYADCAARVKNVVDNYPARRADVLGYLRSIAWNLSF